MAVRGGFGFAKFCPRTTLVGGPPPVTADASVRAAHPEVMSCR